MQAFTRNTYLSEAYNSTFVSKESADWHYKGTRKTQESRESNEQIASRMAKVWIYYDSLDTTIITQTPKTTMLDLISNIGGILGIFKYLFNLFNS